MRWGVKQLPILKDDVVMYTIIGILDFIGF